MSPHARAVDPGHLDWWCRQHLGSMPAEELFRSGHLSAVIGLRLTDHREVVVKIRPDSPRISACVDVQRHLFQAGYPCPRPLTGATSFDGDIATAETYVPGGDALPSADHAAVGFAEAFARLIRLAPRPAEVSTLDPPPSWADWNHVGDGLWPCPEEDPDVNLGEVAGAEWIDDAGRRARDRLRAGESDAVVGHCDWLAGNLRWSGDSLLVVHDWDSVIAESEAVLVGFAAALYSTGSADELATVDVASDQAGPPEARGMVLRTKQASKLAASHRTVSAPMTITLQSCQVRSRRAAVGSPTAGAGVSPFCRVIGMASPSPASRPDAVQPASSSIAATGSACAAWSGGTGAELDAPRIPQLVCLALRTTTTPAWTMNMTVGQRRWHE